MLGYYLHQRPRRPRRVGVLPAPVIDADALQGRPIAFTRWNGYGANIAALAEAAPVAGFFNACPTPTACVRCVPLLRRNTAARYYESLALAMFRRCERHAGGAAGVPAGSAGWPGATTASAAVALEQGGQRLAIPVDARVAVRVPFRGPGGPQGGSFDYVSAARPAGRPRRARARSTTRWCWWAPPRPACYDLRATPVGEVYPGVEVHANLIAGLLDGRVPVQPDWARGFEVVLLLAAMAVLALALPRLSALAGCAATVVLALGAGGAEPVGLPGHGSCCRWPRRCCWPRSSTPSTPATATSSKAARRRSLARLFGTYVPPELVEEMASDPERYSMQRREPRADRDVLRHARLHARVRVAGRRTSCAR